MGTRWSGLLSAFLAVLFLSACASNARLADVQPPEGAKAVFAVGYNAIAAKYIEPKTARALAIEGLEGLSDADPTLAIEERGGLLWLVQNGRLLRVGVTPRPQNLDAWATLSADFLAVSLANRSPKAKADAAAFTTAMFKRVMESLDSHSRYTNGKTSIRRRENRRGYIGVGLHVQQFEDSFIVTKVLSKSPAENAGIQVSDKILEIGGTPAAAVKLEDFPNRLRGPIHSRLSLVLKRRGVAKPIKTILHRQKLFTATVHYERRKTIAYFRLSSFNRNTARSLARHLLWIEGQPDAPLGIALDLRNNPGGLMDQAIAVADLFLKSGRIVSTHGRHPNSSQTYNAVASDVGTALPIVILLNGKSASSAEIVAAALHDQGRALVVGSRSYGKGSVQTILPLPNGAEITLTWSRLYTPKGNALATGVEPDVCTVGLSKIDAKPQAMFASLEKTRKPGSCPAIEAKNALDFPLAEELLKNAGLYANLSKTPPEEIAHKEALD